MSRNIIYQRLRNHQNKKNKKLSGVPAIRPKKSLTQSQKSKLFDVIFLCRLITTMAIIFQCCCYRITLKQQKYKHITHTVPSI
ncbi:MAG: hypothetical protein ACI8RD_004517 [Bacillariaceae sp.]|jgi:hypothetical protein